MSPRDEEEPELDGEPGAGDDSEETDAPPEADAVAVAADEEEHEEPPAVAADARGEIKRFLEALIEKGVLILVEGATADRLVPALAKALARKDPRRGALFLDALIDHDAVDEVFLDEDQMKKLLTAWF